MTLEEAWSRLEKEKLSVPVGPEPPVAPRTSQHPIDRLRRGYLYSTGYSLLFLVCFVWLAWWFDALLVRVPLLLVVVSYLFFLLVNGSMYRHLRRFSLADQSVRSTLQQTYDLIVENIRFQERSALIIYPIAATAGFMMGAAASGADVAAFINKEVAQWSLLAVVIVLTPISYFAAKWLYRISYRKHLAQLQQVIAGLDEPVA